MNIFPQQPSIMRKLAVLTLGLVVGFLTLLSFVNRAHAQDSSREVVPPGYALVGIGYGSDDVRCWLTLHEGYLQPDGSITNAGYAVRRCAGGGGNDATLPAPYGDWNLWNSVTPATQYINGWGWGANTSGGCGWNGNSCGASSPPGDTICSYQAYRKIDTATGQLVGPILGWNSPSNGDCEEQNYGLPQYVVGSSQIESLKSTVFVSDIATNAVDPDPNESCGRDVDGNVVQCQASKVSFSDQVPPSRMVITGIDLSLGGDGDAFQPPWTSLGSWDGTKVLGADPVVPQDNIPSSFANSGDKAIVGSDGNWLYFTMRNSGQGTASWPLDSPQTIAGSQLGTCTVDLFPYDGQGEAPNLDDPATGGDPAGSSCTTAHTYHSTYLSMQHAGSFSVNPAQTATVLGRVTITKVWDVIGIDWQCSQTDPEGGGCIAWDPNSPPLYGWTYAYDYHGMSGWSIAPGEQAQFLLTDMTAPGVGSYSETWTPVWTGPAYAISALNAYPKTITVGGVATLTANNSTNITVNVGDPVVFAWNSQNGVSFASSFTVDSPDACGSVFPGVNDWAAPRGKSASGNITDAAGACQAGHTYTFTYTVTNAGGLTIPVSVVEKVNAPPLGDVNVNSVSSQIVASLKNGQLPLIGSGQSAYENASCSANSLICGMRSDSAYAYETNILGQKVNPTMKMNQPLCCSVTSGVGTTGGYAGPVDSASQGDSIYCATNQVVMGDYGGSSNQLDRIYCQQLTGSFHWQSGTETLVTPPVTAASLNTDYYCPVGSLIVGVRYGYNKNDSADGFYCAKIEPGNVTDITALSAVPSSWYFPSLPGPDPCGDVNGVHLLSLCSGPLATYHNQPPGTWKIVAPDQNQQPPAGYKLGSIEILKSDIGEKPAPTLFGSIIDWFKNVAHAQTISDGNGTVLPGGSQVLSSGSAITFVISWDPLAITVSSVSASCAPTTISVGQTANCTATVSGQNGPSQAVTWTVTGGGSIDPLTGVYTAPASLGNAITVTITATSQQDPSKADSKTITVQPPATCAPPAQTVNIAKNGGFAITTATGGNGTYSWQAPGSAASSVIPPNQLKVNYANPGTYNVTVSSGPGLPASCSVTTIDLSCTFTGAPASVIVPGKTKLVWTCKNANACNITSSKGENLGNASLPSGNLSVGPTSTMSYFINCTGPASLTYTANTDVTVKNPFIKEP